MKINSKLIQQHRQRRRLNETDQLCSKPPFLKIFSNLQFSLTKIMTVAKESTMTNVFDRHNQQRLFYNVGRKLVYGYLAGEHNATLLTLKTMFDGVIQAERLLFTRSRLLHFIVGFLVAHSDGDSLQCVLNLQLLDYFLTNYRNQLTNESN
ncbi:hypothetical protein [Orgyia leucostigma nucleopolyhedrovirus]|uniref:Uncharacterized protein n=1 Tax=Orgyia leucostigma nucleopolyhedrovirus TaxID=490711 RepID=B0FDZ0_9ABAC|nr:hypothetical protein [Orgyia leucostigma nucleopolyhedrovirus]ABY65848.1 hypothetical protein [Orgyia leucostigma nucleopolyhedrovirus]